MMTCLCIEILGENAFQNYLIQSGWSGKDYIFTFNPATGSHLRAYRRLEDYYAERVDLHRTANVWALVANLLPEDQITSSAFVGLPTAPVEAEPLPSPQPDASEEPSADPDARPARQRKGR